MKNNVSRTDSESPLLCHPIRLASTLRVTGSGVKEPTTLRDHSVPLQTQETISYPVGGSPFVSKYTEELLRENRTSLSRNRSWRGKENKLFKQLIKLVYKRKICFRLPPVESHFSCCILQNHNQVLDADPELKHTPLYKR